MAAVDKGDGADKLVDRPTSRVQRRSNEDEERGKRPRTETRVVRLKRSGDRVVQGCDIYIGRACNMGGWHLPQSKWANPFTVRKEGSVAAAVSKYKEYIMGNSVLLKDLEELRGKTLGCWCHPGPCHGDILVALLRKDTLDVYFASKSKKL